MSGQAAHVAPLNKSQWTTALLRHNVELMDWSAFDGFRRPKQPVRRRTWAGVDSWQETLEAGLNVNRAELAERRRE